MGMEKKQLDRFYEEDDLQQERFLIELSFVEALSNMEYLHWLAVKGYLQKETFIRYIEYLQYWNTYPYVSFIKYPLALENLRLLTKSSFRDALKDNKAIKHLAKLQ